MQNISGVLGQQQVDIGNSDKGSQNRLTNPGFSRRFDEQMREAMAEGGNILQPAGDQRKSFGGVDLGDMSPIYGTWPIFGAGNGKGDAHITPVKPDPIADEQVTPIEQKTQPISMPGLPIHPGKGDAHITPVIPDPIADEQVTPIDQKTQPIGAQDIPVHPGKGDQSIQPVIPDKSTLMAEGQDADDVPVANIESDIDEMLTLIGSSQGMELKPVTLQPKPFKPGDGFITPIMPDPTSIAGKDANLGTQAQENMLAGLSQQAQDASDPFNGSR